MDPEMRIKMAGPSSHFHCCVPQCSSDSRYEANISFHAFPKAEERRGKLILAIRREEGPLFKISKSTVVCGKHFRREEKRKTICKTLLRPGVVPSLFAWHNPPPQRKPPMRRSRLQSRKILADVLIDRQNISMDQDEGEDDVDQKKKDEDEISTAHFSRILPKKQPVLVIQNPVPKLPQTVALGNAPVIVQAVQGPDSGCVPRTGKAKTQQVSHLPLQPTRPGVGLVSLLGKQKTRPVTHSPTQPSKPGVSSVLHTGKPDTRQVSHQPLQPITSMIRELPKILPRPFQATFDSGSSESGSGENGVSLPSTAVSNVIVQTGVPVSFHMSTVPSGAIVDPGTQGAETAVRGALVARLVHGGCSDVVKVLSTDDQSDQQGLPLIKNEPGDHSFENMNSSQEYNMREEVCLKNGFERIVTESGDEYSIVKQEFSDSESSDTDVPMFGIESSGGTDGDKSFPQSIVVKPEPQAGLHMLDEHVSTHNVASHQEHVKHGSVTSDSGMSISQSVTIKQEPNSSFDTPEEHVPVGCLDNCEKHGSVTSDSGVSISQSVVIKQEPHSDFDPPKGHISAGDLDNCNERVKCDSDEVDTDLSSSQCDVSIKKEPPDHTDTLKNVTCADNVADIFPESVSEHFVKYEVT